jgi:hypothetical protein
MDDQGPWTHLLVTAISVAGVAGMIWLEMPEWQRETVKRAARGRLHRGAAAIARASGYRAMGDELSGRQAEAEAGYGFTYRVSRLRDRL